MNKILFLVLLFFSIVSSLISQDLFDFKSQSCVNKWVIVNDDVMGGVSVSKLEISNEKNAVFKGSISLDYNGGFASIRHNFRKKIDVSNFTSIKIRLKGDGKKYQLRIKNLITDYHSYVHNFETNGDWQIITIKLDDMYPSFRGRRLNFNNFNHSSIDQIGLLISNKKKEDFILVIDNIYLL